MMTREIFVFGDINFNLIAFNSCNNKASMFNAFQGNYLSNDSTFSQMAQRKNFSQEINFHESRFGWSLPKLLPSALNMKANC